MRRCGWVVALGLLSACGPQTLEGSLRQVMDLSFDEVELRHTPVDLAVAWVRNSGDTALQVTVSLQGLTLEGGAQINLAEKLTATTQRGVLSRNVRNDTTTRLPALERGTLRLERLPGALDERVSGAFNATFVQGSTEPFGRAVSGTFSAVVRQLP